MVTHIIPIGFHSKQIYAPIKQYGISKLILIVVQGKDAKSKQQVKDAVSQAKQLTNQLLSVPFETVKLDNTYDTEKLFKKFEELFNAEDEIVLNLTGGPKLISLLLYITAVKKHKKVKAIVYVRDDIHESIILPKSLVCGKLTLFEKKLLKSIKESAEISTLELSRKMKRSLTQIITYCNRLEEKELIGIRKEGNKRIVFSKESESV